MVCLSFIFTVGQGPHFEIGYVKIKFDISAPSQNNGVAKIFIFQKGVSD